MTGYAIHTIPTAPPASKPSLERLEKALGMIPNLAASMAESAPLIDGFARIREIQAAGTFTPAEVQVLSLTSGYENGCDYCVGLHSALALKSGVSAEGVSALRAGKAPPEPRLKALSNFCRAMVQKRGAVTEQDLSAFIKAGFSRAQALEVVLGIAVSIMPNFAHHLTESPLDDVFAPHAWERPAR